MLRQAKHTAGQAAGVDRILNRTVVIAALGYFVDIYDLILFTIVRRESLIALGVVGDERLVAVGAMLLNWQMAGLLLGGVLWGVLGDKRGRVSVLFGSILLYSLANIANAFVTTIPQYAALRFLAGVGLAGELGAAVTLVSEVMAKERRGYGTAVIASVGILGGVVAVGVAGLFQWQVAYLVGGTLGLLLLGARMSLVDSGMFQRVGATGARRGAFFMLFTSRERFARYAWCLLVGLPIWFVVGVLVAFSPELAPHLGVTGVVTAGTAVLFTYVGLSVGDLASGFLSGWIRSRRWIFIGFLGLTSALIFVYTLVPALSPAQFYALCGFLGFAIGYWAVFNTNAAEQFGTNLRATVATTAPNFVRGALIPVLVAFTWLNERIGPVRAALVVGQATVLIALFAVYRLRETYGADLEFVEQDAPLAVSAPVPLVPAIGTAGRP